MANEVLLETFGQENSNVIDICRHSAPATAYCKALHRLIVRQFVVPGCHLSVVIERLKYDV